MLGSRCSQQAYRHTEHSTGPACSLPVVTGVANPADSPRPLPHQRKPSLHATKPAAWEHSQVADTGAATTPRGCRGGRQRGTLAGPDAITSTLFRAKPRQRPATAGRGFLPPALGQGSQLSPSPLRRTHHRAGKWVGKHPLNALICLSPEGDRSSSPKRPAPASARRGGWQLEGALQRRALPWGWCEPRTKGECFVFNFHGNRWRNSIFN